MISDQQMHELKTRDAVGFVVIERIIYQILNIGASIV